MFGILTRIIKIVFWLQLYNIVMLIIVPIIGATVSVHYTLTAKFVLIMAHINNNALTQLSRIYFSNIYNYRQPRDNGCAAWCYWMKKLKLGQRIHTEIGIDFRDVTHVYVIVSPNCIRRQKRCDFFYANVFDFNSFLFLPSASRSRNRKAQHTKPFI